MNSVKKGGLDMFKGKMKKSVVMVLALLMLMSSVPSFAATPRFKDVPATHWAFNYIESMAKLGFIAGTGNGTTFTPAGQLNFDAAMSLMARITNPTTEDKINASNKYNDLLNELKIDSWAKEGLAISLYRGIITEAELRGVNSKGNIRKPITKVDTCVYLVKTMGLGDVATSKQFTSLTYKDVLSMTATETKYLAVLIETGVLDPKGSGDGKFNPKSSLTRDVMAKMMSTAYDYMQKNPTTPTTPPVTPETPKPTETDMVNSRIIRIADEITNMPFLIVEDKPSGEIAYIVMNNTTITLDGKSISLSGLSQGLDVELTLKKNTREIISIKAISVEEDINGTIKYLNTTTSKMTVEYKEGSKTVTRDFTVDKKADIYLNNKSSYLKDLKEGDLVKLIVMNGVIHDIEAESKIKKVEGTIKEILPVKDSKDKEYYITVVDSKDISYKFLINSKTYLYRNNKRIDNAGEFKLKDKVYVEAEYDIAIEVDASVVKKNIKGIIVGMNTKLHQNTEVTIANQETKKEETYILGKTVYIRVDKIVTNSLDLKTGYYVEVITEGDEITEIDADSRGVESAIMGEISYINTRTGDITLIIHSFDLDNSKYGDEIIVHIKSDVIIADRNLRPITFNYLTKGDRINVIGSYDGSSFIANTIQVR